MEENNNKKNYQRVLALMFIVVVLLLAIGISYSFFRAPFTNEDMNAKVETGNLALTFSDGSSSFQGSLDFGESATKSFTIENTGSLDAKAKINWKNLKNTYLKESLTYTLSYSETENGTYTDIITNKQVPRSESPVTKTLAYNLTVPVGKTYYYKLVITLNYLEDIDQTADLNAMLSTEFSLVEDKEDYSIGIVPKMVSAMLNGEDFPENSVQEGNPTFANPAETDETANGLYTMQDDYGTSYYFRGSVANNYVKFGGFYWRIIRINGDGSLRMIYDGEQAYANGTSNVGRLAFIDTAWNTTNYNDAKYVGYMYGGSNGTASTKRVELGQEGYAESTNAIYNETSTNIKTEVEKWYKTNIRDKGLDEYVADSIYCNDRTMDSGNGYGTGTTYYGGYARLGVKSASVVNPQFTCENKNDAFTKDDTTKGNGALSEKVGLITGDEVVAAGGKYMTSNSNYYLYKGSWYWSLSPCNYNYAYVFVVYNTGNLSSISVNYTGGVAPVISLKAEYASTLKGLGTMESPYEA